MKKLGSLLPSWAKLPLLKRHLARCVAANCAGRAVTLFENSETTNPLQVSLHKRGPEIAVGLNLAAVTHQPFVYRMVYARLPATLCIFSRSGEAVRAVVADLGDRGDPHPAGLAFCSSRDDVILIPDPVFVNSHGYAEFRRTSSTLPWSRRYDTVLWRGTSTGIGEVTTESMRFDDLALRQRIRMCLMLRAVPGTDVKIRKTEENASPDSDKRLSRNGLLGGKIKQSEWEKYKFAIDVDGHTNAWSNFFVRLLLGCCVIKIQSEHGFRQWYYDRIKPWQHYVPVRADMADLVEKIDWCRSHDAECTNIAKEGQEFAHAMTVESAIGDAVRRLDVSAHALMPA